MTESKQCCGIPPGGAYWTGRLAARGHTGWSEPIIYAFDQLERLEIVRRAVTASFPHGGAALDFGCGTGDFSNLLLELGFDVCGCDPFVRPAIASPRFSHVASVDALDPARDHFDLILCVTVLDHILVPAELDATLAKLRACLNAQGKFLVLEYALDAETDRARLNLHNDYQAFRTLMEWQAILGRHDLRIEKVTAVPHPVFLPARGYAAYLKSPLVRLVWHTRKLPLPRGLVHRLLQKQARHFAGRPAGAGDESGSSPLKFLECVAA